MKRGEEDMKWIDPHIHLFALAHGHYAWLKHETPPFWSDKAVINQTTLEPHLYEGNRNLLAGFVHIEAGFDNHHPWREIQFLEQHCKGPFRSVANIHLTANSAQADINRLVRFHSVVGLRHILDDSAQTILRSPKALHTFKYMAQHQLSFDAQLDLTDTASVSALVKVLEQVPHLTVVVNHVGIAPSSRANLAYKHWQHHLRELGQHNKLAFKFSGMEMQERQWSWQYAHGVLCDVIESVPLSKLMLASNFPLCNLRMPYSELLRGYDRLLKRFDRQTAEQLRYSNAYRWYKFTPQDFDSSTRANKSR